MSYRIEIGELGSMSTDSGSVPFSSEIRLTESQDDSLVRLKSRGVAVASKPLIDESEPVPVRRLRGYLIQDEGDETRVAFVHEGHLTHYYLPSDRLKDAGVICENQPFEMDEFQAVVRGILMSGYVVRPSAQPKDAFEISLDLDEDRRRKLNYIMNREWDARD